MTTRWKEDDKSNYDFIETYQNYHLITMKASSTKIGLDMDQKAP